MDKWLYDSCKIHDYCYRTSGMTKDTCDYQFYLNMKTQCGDSKICSKVADKAYVVLQSAPQAKEQYAATSCCRHSSDKFLWLGLLIMNYESFLCVQSEFMLKTIPAGYPLLVIFQIYFFTTIKND